jgi:hypothetical protein
MAELQINVTTTADTAGLDEVKAKLAGVSKSVADQLAAAGAVFDPAKGAFTSAAKEVENIGFNATIAGASLNKARGEAMVLARELATGSVNARTIGALLGALGTPFTIAAIAGLGLFHVIANMAKELVAFNNELKKMSDELNKQETQWINLAERAGDFGDALKLSEKMQPELDKLSAQVDAFRNKQIGAWDKFTAAFTGSFAGPWGVQSGNAQQNKETMAAMDELTRGLLTTKAAGDEATRSALEWQIALGQPLPEAIIQYSGIVGNLKDKLAAAYEQWTKLITVDPGKATEMRSVWVQLAADLKVAQDRLDQLTGDQNKLNQGADKDAEAAKRREINDLLKQESIELEGIRQQQDLIKSNPFLTIQQQQTLEHNLALREQQIVLAEILKTEAEIAALKAGGDPKDITQIDRLIGELQKLQTEYQKLGFTMQTTDNFGMAFFADTVKWANSFGTTSTQVFGAFKQTATDAFSALNQWIVTGTFNLQSFLQQIELIGLKLLEQLAIQEAVSLIGGALGLSQAKSIGPQIAASYAGAATAVSTASWGLAPAIGAGAELAALGTITGALRGSGFQPGGFTGYGADSDYAGPAHRMEFVFGAEAVRTLGVPFLERLHAAAKEGRSGIGGIDLPPIGDPEGDYGTQPPSRGFAETGTPPVYAPGADLFYPSSYLTYSSTSTSDNIPPENIAWNAPPMPNVPAGGAGGSYYGGGWPGYSLLPGGNVGGADGRNTFGDFFGGNNHPIGALAASMLWEDFSHFLPAGTARADWIRQTMTGGAGLGSGAGGLRGSGGDVHVHNYTDLKTLVKELAGREGRNIINDTIRGSSIDLGIRRK